MKKLLSLLLVLLVIVTLVGCSQNTNSNNEVEELKATIAEQEALIESNYQTLTELNEQIDKALTDLGYSLDYDSIHIALETIINELENTRNELYEAERKLEEYENK